MQKAYLILEDGTVFAGNPIGIWQENSGEVVFNTSMAGYQEILTDPSYAGQIIVLTYPLIGNYGVCDEFSESKQIHAAGLIVSECCATPHHWQKQLSLSDYLTENGIPGLTGLDTRALTKHLRTFGTMRGLLSQDPSQTLSTLTPSDENQLRGITQLVSTKQTYAVNGGGSWRVALVDFGVKQNIIDSLKAVDAEVIIYPATSSAKEVMQSRPDALLLSNGPGNPADCAQGVNLARELAGQIPTMGICLGHQLLALAHGASTYRLKFGHRGGNHPVKSLANGRINITSQNHGYAVNLEGTDTLQVTHINQNDGSVEGFRHRELPILAVQFQPETSSGTADNLGLFQELRQLAIVQRG